MYIPKKFHSLSGDNVVELYNQFGLKLDKGFIIEHVNFKKHTIFLVFKPFYKQYTPLNHFHSDILNYRQMHDAVLKYIRD